MKYPKLYEILPADKVFYMALSGNHAFTIRFHVTLAQSVNPQALRNALKQTMRLHPRFRMHPVVSENKLYTVIAELKEVPLFSKTNDGRHYGTDDTFGYMHYVTYSGRDIYFHIFHGVSDGRGVYMFVDSLLHHYFTELGYLGFQNNLLPETPSELPEQADIVKLVLKKTEGLKELARTNIEHPFRIPESLFDDHTFFARHMEIDVALLPLLAMAKRYESSPVPVLQALIGETLREVYDVGDETIVAYTPIDLRPIFGLETTGNASSAMYIPFRPRMENLNLEMKSTSLRASLELQSQQENLRHDMEAIAKTVSGIDSLTDSVPLSAIVDGANEQMKTTYRNAQTYLISYIGKTPVSDEIAPFIESIRSTGDPYDTPLTIVVAEHKGTLRLMFSMFFNNDKVVRKIYEKLKTAVPETVILDRGMIAQDALLISELETLD